MSCGKVYLTEEVKAVIGTTGERRQASLWGIEKEGLRRFSQAVMDPDPRYWDEEFAKSTRYGKLITPAIYCSYLGRKTQPGDDDPISRAFREDPNSDGISGMGREEREGGLPPVPTELRRVLNGGNEIEVYQYPTLGDVIFSQSKYSDIRERTGRDGSHMLLIVTENTFTNQDGDLLCILRSVGIRR